MKKDLTNCPMSLEEGLLRKNGTAWLHLDDFIGDRLEMTRLIGVVEQIRRWNPTYE